MRRIWVQFCVANKLNAMGGVVDWRCGRPQCLDLYLDVHLIKLLSFSFFNISCIWIELHKLCIYLFIYCLVFYYVGTQ